MHVFPKLLVAANAALALAAPAVFNPVNNLAARNGLPAVGPANGTEHYVLKQWNPHEHVLDKRNNDHKPSPSPHHPSDSDDPDHPPTHKPTKPTHNPSKSYTPHDPTDPPQHTSKDYWQPTSKSHGPSKPWKPEEPTHPPGPSQLHHHADVAETTPARLQPDTHRFALYGSAAAYACDLTTQIVGAEITACPLEGGQDAWDCINTLTTLESCGGCMSLGEGQDCTLLKGVDTVGCIHGKCVIGKCGDGYWLDSENMQCVAT